MSSIKAIECSTSMMKVVNDSAWNIVNCFNGSTFPLEDKDVQPFLTLIKRQVKNIFESPESMDKVR